MKHLNFEPILTNYSKNIILGKLDDIPAISFTNRMKEEDVILFHFKEKLIIKCSTGFYIETMIVEIETKPPIYELSAINTVGTKANFRLSDCRKNLDLIPFLAPEYKKIAESIPFQADQDERLGKKPKIDCNGNN